MEENKLDKEKNIKEFSKAKQSMAILPDYSFIAPKNQISKSDKKLCKFYFFSAIISIICILIFLLLAYISFKTSDTSNEVKLPLIEKREFRRINLSNNMKLLLISDPLIKNSAVSLTVKTGSFVEGSSDSGLNNLMQNLLAKPFKKYIQEKEGSFSLESGNEFTSFYFSINSEDLFNSLENFAKCFYKKNNFDRKDFDMEIQELTKQFDSKNIKEKNYKITSLLKILADNNHPFSQFPFGNNNLKNDNIFEELDIFFKKFYSANLMSLVVLSPQILSKVESEIKKKFLKLHFFQFFIV